MGRNQAIAVCHLISGDLWAGPEVQISSLLMSIHQMKQLDLSVIVLNEGKLSKVLQDAGIRVRIIEERRHTFPTILKLARRELEGHTVDILHTHRYKENVLGMLLKKTCRVRHLVQTVHGTRESFSGFKSLKISLYARLNDYATRHHYTKVIAVSHDIARQLVQKFGPEKLTAIHNAVDTPSIRVTHTPDQMRKNLNLPPGRPVIGTVGRMVPIKGFERFLAVARNIHQQRPEVIFLLVGDGPDRARYESLAKDMGLMESTRFLGFRDDIWDVVNCFDLFVMTSYHEGIPVVLLEAMTLRRPVVAMAVGGIPEIIEDRVSGLLVSPGDINGVASACLDLLSQPLSCRRLGESARARIESEFSLEMQRDRVMSLYRELSGRT